MGNQGNIVRNPDIIDIDITADSIDQAIGSAIEGHAVTAKLHVSPSGNNSDGSTWEKAYNALPTALAAASIDANDITLILIAPATYDINVTGDPTYSSNIVLKGSHRNWTKITNEHATATSIMKFTGKVSLEDLTFDPLATAINGVIISGAGTKGSRVRKVYFENESVTGAQTALEISGGTEYIRMEDVKIHGVQAHTKALLLDNCKLSNFEKIDIHECLTGLQQTNAASDNNVFDKFHFDTVTLGIDLDAGNLATFDDIHFINCTTNVDDEVGDASWADIKVELDIVIEPDNFTGVTVATHANANTWTTVPVEVRAAATSTTPFIIVGFEVEGNAAEKFRVRFSHDGGTTWFDDLFVEGEVNAVKRQAIPSPSATSHIFNKGTQIVAAAKSESGGNSVVVWLELQEI